MTDFWEIIGRMATNTDGLAERLKEAYTTGQFQPAYEMDLTGRVSIPAGENNDYVKLRRIVRNDGAGMVGPVSLMAAGEILVVIRIGNFWGLFDAVRAAVTEGAPTVGIQTTGREPLFLSALGALILDDQARNDVLLFSDTFGPAAKNQQVLDARTLAGVRAVSDAADELCREAWNPDCLGKLVEWSGHRHPLASPKVLV